MTNDRLATIVAYVFAAAFLLATGMGVVPNPLVGDGALFHTNTAHNLVHLATALGFTLVAQAGGRASILFMKGFGVVYLLVGVLGFFVIDESGFGHLLGVVHINSLDNYLHLGLGAAILASGIVLGRRSSAETAPASSNAVTEPTR